MSKRQLIIDLISKTKRMRSLQTTYFETRDKKALRGAQDLERQVDKLLEEITSKQQKLLEV